MQTASIEEMINDYSHGTYNFTDNGKCIECGNCCSRYLLMTQKEINIINKYIEKHKIKRQMHVLNVLNNTTDVIDCYCPFLDITKSNHKCTIYEVRPEICRVYKCDYWGQKDRRPPLQNKNLRVVDLTEQFYGDKG